MKQNKRGQLNMLLEFILFIAVAVIVSILVFTITQDARDDSLTEGKTINNETLTTVDEIGEYVSNRTVCAFSGASVVEVTLEDNGTIVSADNYTINSDTGLLQYIGGTDDHEWNNTDWNATYTFTGGKRISCDATLDADEALAKIPKNLKLLATAVIFGAVLFVILRVIPRFSGSGSVGGF